MQVFRFEMAAVGCAGAYELMEIETLRVKRGGNGGSLSCIGPKSDQRSVSLKQTKLFLDGLEQIDPLLRDFRVFAHIGDANQSQHRQERRMGRDHAKA